MSNSRGFLDDVKMARKDIIRNAFDSFYIEHFDVKGIRQASEYMDRKRGVDVVIDLRNGESLNSQEKIVCAWFTQNPGSVYVEIKMVYENGDEKQGWVYDDCDADILAICYEKYKPNNEPKCFGFKMKEFKQVAQANIERWHTIYRLLETPSTHNDATWITYCLLVPYDEIRQLIDDTRVVF